MQIKNLTIFKKKALLWAQKQSTIICCLDNNEQQQDKYGKYEFLLAVGAKEQLICGEKAAAFGQWEQFAKQYANQWLFGTLAYDLKNEVEQLSSSNPDAIAWPELYFFVPQYLIIIDKKGNLEIVSENENKTHILAAIVQEQIPLSSSEKIEVLPKISKEKYLATIASIKQHIIEGDIYEMNFCQEFYAQAELNPLALYHQVNEISKAPFGAYFAKGKQHLLCGSPERFVAKRNNKIISQPIKGTIKRGETPKEDEQLKKTLLHSEKDRAENVMIVDLVRNDLTKTCQTGTIQVEELFGIYSFEKVHQMISTVTAQKRMDKHWTEVIAEAFPMGSMTGAPKVMSMQLIEHYEQSKRGLYSGAVGYVNPQGDFDFNVVIRSILYNQSNDYLSFQVGGAIVYDSDAEAEYAECLLKAKGILEALGARPSFVE